MLGSGSTGGGALLVPRAVPPRPLTPSPAPLGDSLLAAWEPVALLALDGTIRAGNTLYSRYCKTSKRTKLKCRHVRLGEEQEGEQGRGGCSEPGSDTAGLISGG